MIEPTMNSEEISALMGKLIKLRDGLDDFNCQLASIDGSTMRLGLLCEETAVACPPGAAAMAQAISGLARALRSFGGTTGDGLPVFSAAADGVARGMRLLEIESRKGAH
jgi:hypothetical protein